MVYKPTNQIKRKLPFDEQNVLYGRELSALGD
jgi:hypothetical protein